MTGPMRVSSDRGDYLEIARADRLTDDYAPALLVRVGFRGFTAEAECSVPREGWLGFTQDLVILETRRQGVAKVESISPGELALVVRSLDHAGHVGVEGTVGHQSYHGKASLTFGVLAFDQSQLVGFVCCARAISASLE